MAKRPGRSGGGGSQAAAQTWPTRSIDLVHGLAAGGNADTVARLIAALLESALGKSLQVMARPGAGGNIATELVARSRTACGPSPAAPKFCGIDPPCEGCFHLGDYPELDWIAPWAEYPPSGVSSLQGGLSDEKNTSPWGVDNRRRSTSAREREFRRAIQIAGLESVVYRQQGAGHGLAR